MLRASEDLSFTAYIFLHQPRMLRTIPTFHRVGVAEWRNLHRQLVLSAPQTLRKFTLHRLMSNSSSRYPNKTFVHPLEPRPFRGFATKLTPVLV